MTELTAGLNEAQQQAVLHEGGPLLVIAGAGTGKTKTLAARVARLIERGISPERILLLTFSRRAAQEMLSRAASAVGQEPARRVWSGTFHAVANRLLRAYGDNLDLPRDFTVIDEEDASDVMGLVRNELSLAKDEARRFPKKSSLLAMYSRAVNTQTKLSVVLEKHFPWCSRELDGIRPAMKGYVQRKREQQLLDFDDLLLCWRDLMETPAGTSIRKQFDHVLVDEYQDMNHLQADILRQLRLDNSNITVVGDDAQAIYAFRGATVDNILQFPQHFPGATIVQLEQNYRSGQAILDVANAVMEQSQQRYTKALWSTRTADPRPMLVTCLDEAQQADLICRAVLEQREQGIELRQQAVLMRSGHHSAVLEIELGRRNIPFHKFGGLRFVEGAHIKDVLAILRVVQNPWDELAWFRSLQLVDGVGPAMARDLMKGLTVRRTADPREPGALSPLSRFLAEPEASRKAELHGLADAMAAASGQPPATQVEAVQRFYLPVLEHRYDNPAVRQADLEQLQQLARGYSSMERFLGDMTLDPPTATSDLAGIPHLDDDYLILSTIHSAKGGEWSSVYVIHASDGMMPSDMSTGSAEEIEEERRLLYVALTRAKDHLSVYFPLRYYHRRFGRGDSHNFSQISRFLQPVAPLFDRRAAHEEGLVADDGTSIPSRDRKLAALWDD